MFLFFCLKQQTPFFHFQQVKEHIPTQNHYEIPHHLLWGSTMFLLLHLPWVSSWYKMKQLFPSISWEAFFNYENLSIFSHSPTLPRRL